ncbi:uncharacterized protein FYW61_005518 [Anableps anableps]
MTPYFHLGANAVSVLSVWLFLSAGALEKDTPELHCGEGLSDCHMSTVYFSGAPPDPYGTLYITHIQLNATHCRTASDCEPCLQIEISLQVGVDFEKHNSEGSADDSDEEAVVKVCHSLPGSNDLCRAVQFKPAYMNPSFTYKVLLTEKVDFETPVLVIAESKETYIYQNITIPAAKEVCPPKRWNSFVERTAVLRRMQHNVTVTMVESQLRSENTGLSWNVTSPCKVEAEVQLCKKDLAGGQCEEVTGSKQRLNTTGWTAGHRVHWQAGEFFLMPHPRLCVQVKSEGMVSFSEPQCPFETHRVRWIILLLVGFILICLAVLGVYLIRGILKGYVWRWLKDDDVKGAVGGGHVMLLYPPDDDKHLPELLCHLGSSLQALGFTVSLDLWSQGELSVLGPVPWLHSRLDRLKRQGGKVVLVLTQTTWTRAEEWGTRSCENNDENIRGMEDSASSRHVDVFGASLSCIFADYLQGRAGERFMLVQFESLPPAPPGGYRPLPRLFCGLHLYSLPSQSLGFLTELTGSKQIASASARRKRAGGLRMASRAFAKGLSGFTRGTNVLHLAGEEEDSGEALLLEPNLITPPSSPDTVVSKMDWV